MICFADTHYYLALLNPQDIHHQQAVAYSRRTRGRVITSAWVLTELADGLAHHRHRAAFIRLYQTLAGDPDTEIVPPAEELFERGLQLYEQRPDKDWSLTDCLCFEIMRDLQISEALTADHHFEQAGFVALLK